MKKIEVVTENPITHIPLTHKPITHLLTPELNQVDGTIAIDPPGGHGTMVLILVINPVNITGVRITGNALLKIHFTHQQDILDEGGIHQLIVQPIHYFLLPQVT